MSQLTTKSGKPIINRITKTPIYTRSVDYRIKKIKLQLGMNIGKLTPDEVWSNIVANVNACLVVRN